MVDGAPLTSPSAPASGANRARLFAALRLAFALALLAVVGWSVPWRDRLQVHEGSEVASIPGVIVGPWNEASVGFVPAEELDPSSFPARLASDWAASGPEGLRLARRAEGADGYEWRPGIRRVWADADAQAFLLPFALLFLAILVGVVRWWRLLAAVGVRARLWTCARLTFLGVFFNLVVPGLTGGDLVKAVLVVRENPTQRADAFVSVVVDRVLGLFVIIAMTAVAVSLSPGTFGELRAWVLLMFAALCVGAWCFLGAWPRRVLRIDALLARLPQAERLSSLDRAVREYTRHKGTLCVAILLSIANHVIIALALWSLTRAFGTFDLGYWDVLGAGAIANVVSSVPLAPGGWGVGEAVYGFVYAKLGAPATIGIAVSVSYRLLMTAMGLLGGLFLLTRSARAEAREVQG
ncbi:MAG: hypothetical protein RL112_1482 [Planctomycetota bacterium]